MKRVLLLTAALLAVPAYASGGAVPFHFEPDTGNVASLQRGARNYMNYCAGCHSMKYLRYNRLAKDLGIPEDLLKENLMFTSDKVGDSISVALPKDAEQWFGRMPPDLTLETRLRGPDWVYSYLLGFYLDPAQPNGVNNIVLPGLSMPHVLGELQGWQVIPAAEAAEGEANAGVHAKPQLELAEPGTLNAKQYKEFVGDLTNFMVYAAEPGRNDRIALGFKVMFYLVLLLGMTYLLKREFWKDVH